MSIAKTASSPYTHLVINIAYALGHCTVGILTRSWWFLTIGAYYSVLSVARFSVLQVRRKSGGDPDMEQFAKRITGILIVALSFCLIGINTLSVVDARGTVHHEIIMIAIATYTFSKITVAIIGLTKAKQSVSAVVKALRNISFVDALVSIGSLQRSMLVSFPGMTTDQIRLFNILTGTAVWILVFILGIDLLGGKIVTMAKSKIVEANEKIAEAVVDGYKKIEKSVVDGYTKIEDRFVEAYLTKDGETVEQAKARLKNKDSHGQD